jgi:hypothetical protein
MTAQPDNRIMQITIETYSAPAKAHCFKVKRSGMPTFLIMPKEVKFYSFDTLDGAQETFLYSDIRHISFREI